jgi:hypothetical protein
MPFEDNEVTLASHRALMEREREKADREREERARKLQEVRRPGLTPAEVRRQVAAWDEAEEDSPRRSREVASFDGQVERQVEWLRVQELARQKLAEEAAAVGGEPLVPLDLAALLHGEAPELSWLVEPLILEGGLTTLYSSPGKGKSLLSLLLACGVASGAGAVDTPSGTPRPVVYLDMEMRELDVQDRLLSAGYAPEHPRFAALAEHLAYYSLPALPPLDTPAGGAALERIVLQHDAALVVVDTLSRVVEGAENDADTYLRLGRHTEQMLKRHGVACLHLDHLGKDESKGARGSSAKAGTPDLAWKLTSKKLPSGVLELTLVSEKGRQRGTTDRVELHLDDRDGVLRLSTPRVQLAGEELRLERELDRLGIDPQLGQKKAVAALREAGVTCATVAAQNAQKHRRNRQRAEADAFRQTLKETP